MLLLVLTLPAGRPARTRRPGRVDGDLLAAGQFANGRRFRVLNIVDDVTKECLGAIPDTSISGRRVARELTAIVAERGRPGAIVSDNGTEFTCNAMLAWCKETGIDWHFIAPGKPIQNAFVENFNGQKRSNDTLASTTDPDARLDREGKGKETKLCFTGHGLMENRLGLLVDACLTQADGHAERVAALHMIEPRADQPAAITLGADKASDAEDFVNELRSMNVTPHVAQNTSGRSSAIDGRTTRHGGYAISQRIEEAFGWIKTVAGQKKSSFRGRDHVGWVFTFAAAAYNLVRLPRLIAEAG